MSAWDTAEIKIGKNVRGGGGGPRETVVRGQSALNAARRAGAVVGTEKKYATGNVRFLPRRKKKINGIREKKTNPQKIKKTVQVQRRRPAPDDG